MVSEQRLRAIVLKEEAFCQGFGYYRQRLELKQSGFESSIPAGEEKSWEPAAKTTTIYNIKCFVIMSIFHCFNVFSFIFSLKVMHLKMPFEK